MPKPLGHSHIPISSIRRAAQTDPTGRLFTEFQPTGGSDPDAIEAIPCKYSSTDFLMPAANSAGQSARAQCKLPPLLARQISEFVSCRKFPFRTDSDVVRWCIFQGLDILHNMEPLAADFLMRALAEIDILKDQMLWATQKEYIRVLDDSVRKCTEIGQWTEAFKIVMGALDRMKDTPDDVWKRRTIYEIREKFRHVLEYDRRRSGAEE